MRIEEVEEKLSLQKRRKAKKGDDVVSFFVRPNESQLQ